jgi:hypothetical protein
VLSNWKNYLSLTNEDDKIGSHEFLYFWLVENYHMVSGENSYVFQSVKAALEVQNHPNPLLVQKFACRAHKEQRKSASSADNQSTITGIGGCRTPCHVMDDSEDEL